MAVFNIEKKNNYSSSNAQLKFAWHAVNRDTIASATEVWDMLEEMRRYQIDIGIGRNYRQLQ